MIWDLNQVSCLPCPSFPLLSPSSPSLQVMLIGNLPSLSDKVVSALKSSFPKFRSQWQWQKLLVRGVRGQGGHHSVEGELIYSILWLPNEEFPISWGVMFSRL